jgi:hypothetical protein
MDSSGDLSAERNGGIGKDNHRSHFSKAKWKKKKYLLTKDVTALTAQNHPKAVHKAEEMIRRMWTLVEKANDVSF